jgi:hypothetical protein
VCSALNANQTTTTCKLSPFKRYERLPMNMSMRCRVSRDSPCRNYVATLNSVPFITEMNGIQLVLFGMQTRDFGSYLTTINRKSFQSCFLHACFIASLSCLRSSAGEPSIFHLVFYLPLPLRCSSRRPRLFVACETNVYIPCFQDGKGG